MPEQEIIAARAFEKVIDAGYKDLPIFSRPTEVAFYGVLAAYDSHLVTQKIVRERRDWEPLSVGQTQFFKSLAEGLVWAVRSLLETQQPSEAHPVASSQVVSEANELLMYGAKYFIVGMMYSASVVARHPRPSRCQQGVSDSFIHLNIGALVVVGVITTTSLTTDRERKQERTNDPRHAAQQHSDPSVNCPITSKTDALF